MSKTFTEIIETVSMGQDLSDDSASEAMRMILSGNVSSEEIAAFLMGMRMKGETVDELTNFVKEMRSASVPVEVDTNGAVDLCGTGGDRSGTFNISTTAMFIVAGAGVPVLKHGNRSVSSKSGSFDVLEQLGAVPALKKEQVQTLYNETGMAFMFAPYFHPAMKHVMPARRALGIRTFFNILGPLVNPANVKNQVIGVFNHDMARNMISILANLDTENAFTLNAHDGLDEVSTTSQTEVFELKTHLSGESVTFDPESLGYSKVTHEELKGGDAALNAEILRSVLSGDAKQAQRDIAELNAAFAIRISGKTDNLEEARDLARESIDKGKALKKLDIFIEESQKAAKG